MAFGWQNTPPYSINEAEQRGDDVYEVLITGWGNVDGANDSALQWPPSGEISLPISLAGIALGPRSTVDRAWVSYNLQKKQTVTGDGISLSDRLRYLSRDTPLMFTQTAINNKKNTPGQKNDPIKSMIDRGVLYVYPATELESTFDSLAFDMPEKTQLSTVLPTFTGGGHFKDVNGVSHQFGLDDNALFLPPTLHLYLYLRSPVIYAPTKRAPLVVTANVNITQSANVEAGVAQIPTFGRRSIHVMMMTLSGSASTNFRVGALRGMKFDNSTDGQEAPVDSITGVAANVPVILSPCAGADVYADYLNLYATVATNNAHVLFQVTAYD